MTFKEAKQTLLLHSFSHSDLSHPKMATGFLGSLRPYQGIKEENFREVMEAIKSLAEYFQKEPLLDKEIVNALWGICHLARAWGVHPDGMLRRNNLISEKEHLQLEEWIETISYATMMLLDGCDMDIALEEYNKSYAT